MRRMLLPFDVLLLAVSANAQWQRFDDRDYDGGRPGWHAPYRADLIDRVLRDIDAPRQYEYVDHHDRGHFEDARKDLLRFQERWARGDFDKGRLSSAINNIHHLVESRYLDPRERRVLERDLWDLRSFLDSRGYNRGYENSWR
jgi:hypothetical protein